MQFDVIIPSTANIHNMARILTSIEKQTVMPQHIFLIVDKYFESDEERQELTNQTIHGLSEKLTSRLQAISHVTNDFLPGQGVSYVRNYGIHHAKSPYIYFIDNDNVLDADFFEISLKEYQMNSHHDTLLYSPTVGRRDTHRIQSVGIRTYHYRLGRPEPMMGGWKTKLFGALCGMFRKKQQDKHFYYPEMIGGNSLLGKTSHCRQLLFDERMQFIYEDIDFTHRRFRQIGPIAVSKRNVIHHMERDKTRLEKSFIATPDGAYQKAKNMLIFVANNGTKKQQLLFRAFGLHTVTRRFVLFILLFGKNKRKLIGAYDKGLREGGKAFTKPSTSST